MTTLEKYKFIINFFQMNNINYSIFDNKDKLNHQKCSDIDIIVENNFEIKSFVKYLLVNKCKIINLVINDYSYQFYFIKDDSVLIHVDLMPGCILRGIDIFKNLDSILVSDSENSMNFTNKFNLYYYELLRSLILTNQIPKKYSERIKENYSSLYENWVIKEYGFIFNKNILHLIEKDTTKYSFKKNFIKYSCINNFTNIFNILFHYYSLIKRYINYPGIYIINEDIEKEDFKVLKEIFTDIIYIDNSKNLVVRIKNSIRLFKLRGENKLVIASNSNPTFFNPDLVYGNKSKINKYLFKRTKSRYKKYFE